MSALRFFITIALVFFAVELFATDGDVTLKTDKIIVVVPDSETVKNLEKVIKSESEEEKKSSQEEITPSQIITDFIRKRDFSKLKNEIAEKLKNVKFSSAFESWKFFFLAVGIFFTLLFSKGIRVFIEKVILGHLAKKTKSDVDDLIGEALTPAATLFVLSLGFFISASPLMSSFPSEVHKVSNRLFMALCAASLAWGIYRLVTVLDFYMAKLARSSESNVDDLIANLTRKSLKIAIALVSVLFIGQNILGLNITTLLAGAGVIGLAIAFAAQDTIGNFFGSIMIILDKPFKVGDRIKVSGVDGSVENVGFRSTRIRTLDGHLVTVPNKDVANTSVENVGMRPYVKFFHNVTLVYDTPADKMERAVKILHEIYDGHEGMDPEMPPRIYFSSFNDWALNIMVIVWYHPGDYFAAQEWNHKMNIKILKRFNSEGLEFAFPTNTTYLAYDDKRKLRVEIDKKKKKENKR